MNGMLRLHQIMNDKNYEADAEGLGRLPNGRPAMRRAPLTGLRSPLRVSPFKHRALWAAGKTKTSTLSEGTGLAGLWDDITSVISGAKTALIGNLRGQFQTQLDKAQADIENKVGQFLSSASTIQSVKARAQAQANSKNPDVKSRAIAIVNKADGLMGQYGTIQSQGAALLSQIAQLKIQIQTNPVFNFDSTSQMGTAVLTLFNQYKEQIANAVSNAALVNRAIDSHMTDVNSLSSDVTSLENFAQGKGFTSVVSSITGSIGTGLGSNIVKPAVYVGVAALAVYFLAPSFFGRMARR